MNIILDIIIYIIVIIQGLLTMAGNVVYHNCLYETAGVDIWENEGYIPNTVGVTMFVFGTLSVNLDEDETNDISFEEFKEGVRIAYEDGIHYN